LNDVHELGCREHGTVVAKEAAAVLKATQQPIRAAAE
jgi:hypothetical protein